MLPTSAPSTNVVNFLQDLEGFGSHEHRRHGKYSLLHVDCKIYWQLRCIPSLALLVCGMTSFSFLVSGMPITMLILLCGTNSDTPSLVQPTSQFSLTRSCYIGLSSPRVRHSLCGCDLPTLISKSNYRGV